MTFRRVALRKADFCGFYFLCANPPVCKEVWNFRPYFTRVFPCTSILTFRSHNFLTSFCRFPSYFTRVWNHRDRFPLYSMRYAHGCFRCFRMRVATSRRPGSIVEAGVVQNSCLYSPPSKRCSRGYSSRRFDHCSTVAAPGTFLADVSQNVGLGGRLLPYSLKE